VVFNVNSHYVLKQHQPIHFVMVKYDVLFEVRTELLNII
jgi:hypothetical protein